MSCVCPTMVVLTLAFCPPLHFPKRSTESWERSLVCRPFLQLANVFRISTDRVSHPHPSSSGSTPVCIERWSAQTSHAREFRYLLRCSFQAPKDTWLVDGTGRLLFELQHLFAFMGATSCCFPPLQIPQKRKHGHTAVHNKAPLYKIYVVLLRSSSFYPAQRED